VVVQGLGEATAWNIQVSLKFLLVVNIVMLSAAVVTPSLSASGSSARLLSLFPPTCLFSLSLSLSPFFFLSFLPVAACPLSPFVSGTHTLPERAIALDSYDAVLSVSLFLSLSLCPRVTVLVIYNAANVIAK